MLAQGSCKLAMFLRQKTWQQQHATVSIVLALATLGGTTIKEMIKMLCR
jgi:hypothetical protein